MSSQNEISPLQFTTELSKIFNRRQQDFDLQLLWSDIEKVFEMAKTMIIPKPMVHGKNCSNCNHTMHCKSIKCPNCFKEQRKRKRQVPAVPAVPQPVRVEVAEVAEVAEVITAESILLLDESRLRQLELQQLLGESRLRQLRLQQRSDPTEEIKQDIEEQDQYLYDEYDGLQNAIHFASSTKFTTTDIFKIDEEKQIWIMKQFKHTDCPLLTPIFDWLDNTFGAEIQRSNQKITPEGKLEGKILISSAGTEGNYTWFMIDIEKQTVCQYSQKRYYDANFENVQYLNDESAKLSVPKSCWNLWNDEWNKNVPLIDESDE